MGDYKSDYNLFNILGVEHREVILCRFLAYLLDPNEAHNKKKEKPYENLQSFIDKVIIANVAAGSNHDTFPDWDENSDYKYAWVETEHYIRNNERRIDIVLASPTKFIPIEVKIYASDQPHQLYDYWDYSKKMNYNTNEVYVCYLTVDKDRKPESDSLHDKTGNNRVPDNNLIHISFEEVKTWVQDLIAGTDPPFKSAIQQYKETLERFISNPADVSKEDSTEKLEIIRKVIKRIEKEMDELGYIRETVYDKGKPEAFLLNHKENRYGDNIKGWPGLNYRIEKLDWYKGINVDLLLRIEIYRTLWVGIVAYNMDNKDELENDTDKSRKLWDEIKKNHPYKTPFNSQDNWNVFLLDKDNIIDPSRKTGSNIPDFQHMNKAALGLKDDSILESYVKSIIGCIKEYIYDNGEIKFAE